MVDPPRVGRSAPRSGSIRPKKLRVVPPHLEARIVDRTPCEVGIRLKMMRLKVKISKPGL